MTSALPSVESVAAFNGIFSYEDHTRDPFLNVQAKALVYPTAPFLTDEFGGPQFEAAVRESGDTAFYRTILELENDPFLRETQEFNINDMNTFLHAATPFVNALYSPRSSWGIVFSHEGHALVGGSSGFVRTFNPHGGSQEAQATAFYAEWLRFSRPDLPPEWTRELLASLYGDEVALEFQAAAVEDTR